jgi:ABC-type polysaccharide/polyol phosphate export permease
MAPISNSHDTEPQPEPSVWTGLAVQRRVVGALLIRELLTRYGRHNIGFLWMFIEPMIFTLMITLLWSFVRKSGVDSNISIVAFAITGYSAVMMWRGMPSRCIGAIAPNLALLFHRPVKVIDVYVARLLLEMLGATTSFVVLSLAAIAAGFMTWPEDVLKVAAGWLMLAWFGFSLAILIGPLSEKFALVEKVWRPISYILFPLSGTAFVVDALPPAAQNVILLLPMVHGLELMRDGYFGSAFHAIYDMGYMAMICMGMSLVGLSLVREIERKGVGH